MLCVGNMFLDLVFANRLWFLTTLLTETILSSSIPGEQLVLSQDFRRGRRNLLKLKALFFPSSSRLVVKSLGERLRGA